MDFFFLVSELFMCRVSNVICEWKLHGGDFVILKVFRKLNVTTKGCSV